MATDSSFFEEIEEQSVVKASIVDKYFWAWFNVMKGQGHVKKIAYIDLFSGPGRYQDGKKSTPLRILERAIATPELSQKLACIFNDKDSETTSTLQKEINALEGVDTLKSKPYVMTSDVGDGIAAMFEKMKLVPTFFFVDPWGYKGLSLRLVNSVVKDWGCDAVFFFNYNRISMGIANPMVKPHMLALFGSEPRLQRLVESTEGCTPEQREALVIEAMVDALQDHGPRFVLPFRFRNANGTRTSHHLIFVSKNVLGYSIMKGIMANHSSSKEDGVASFEFNPRTPGFTQGLLFELSTPLGELEGQILKLYSGRTLTVKEIFDGHHVNKPFILPNYQTVLKRMEAEGKVTMDPPADKRRKRLGQLTLGENTKVSFPKLIPPPPGPPPMPR